MCFFFAEEYVEGGNGNLSSNYFGKKKFNTELKIHMHFQMQYILLTELTIKRQNWKH